MQGIFSSSCLFPWPSFPLAGTSLFSRPMTYIDSSHASLLGSSDYGWWCAFLQQRSNAGSRGRGCRKITTVLTRYCDKTSGEDMILTLALVACILDVHVRHEHYHRCGLGSSAPDGNIPLEHGVGRALRCNVILLYSSTVSITNILVASSG